MSEGPLGLPVVEQPELSVGNATQALSRPSEPSLAVTVYGEARPGGSKSAFPIKDKSGKVKRIAVTESGKLTKEWRLTVAKVVGDAMRAEGLAMMPGPLAVEFDFYRPRPFGHYGTGRNAGVVKDSAPRFPTVRPDALKLARAVEDALSGVAWRDDSEIVVERLRKFYGEPARAELRIWAGPAFSEYVA